MLNTRAGQLRDQRTISKWICIGLALLGIGIPWSAAAADCPYGDHLSLGPSESTLDGADVYRACVTITLLNGYTVGSAGEVLLEAGQRVGFQPGVSVQAGGRLRARVGALPESFRLEGAVVNAPVAAATVTVFTPTGLLTTLATTSSAADGTFALDLPQGPPYWVRSQGGSLEGTPYTGELWGWCPALTGCFVTPWSTVQHELVHEYGYTFADAGVLMEEPGFTADPFTTTQARFDRLAARAAIGDGGGLAGWVEDVAGWLRDPDQAVPPGIVPATEDDYYTITVISGLGGSVTPNGVSAPFGSSVIFSVTPDPGKAIASMTGCGGALLDDGFFIIGFVSASCTVHVSFSDQSFLISPTVLQGGTVSPVSQAVSFGNTVEFEIIPEAGFFVKDVLGCGGSLDGNTFTTGSITQHCDIEVEFTSWEPFTQAFGYGEHVSGRSASLLPENPNRIYVNANWNSFPLIVDYELRQIIYQGADTKWVFAPQPGSTNRVLGYNSGLLQFFESIDAGETWSYFPSTGSFITGPLQYNSSGTTLLALNSDRFSRSSGGSGLQISNDNGRTFLEVAGISGSFGPAFPSPTEGNVILLASNGQLYRSFDSGESWNEIQSEIHFQLYMFNRTDFAHDKNVPGSLMATTFVSEQLDAFTFRDRTVLLWSGDYGDTWDELDFPLALSGLDESALTSSDLQLRLCSAKTSPTTFYLHFRHDPFWGADVAAGGLLKSTDKGVSWSPIDNTIGIGLPSGELLCGYDASVGRSILYITEFNEIYRYLD